MVVDAMGYIEKLNLTGNEYLRMTFGKTNQNSNWIDKIFRVYKVDKRRPEGKGDTESYSLYFCSEEMLLSEQYKVSKSYRAKTISDNVIDILKTYLKVPDKKIGQIDSTYGVYDFTNGAIFKKWDFRLGVMDTIWGSILCGSTIYIVDLLT
jgi:hypothetical protein